VVSKKMSSPNFSARIISNLLEYILIGGEGGSAAAIVQGGSYSMASSLQFSQFRLFTQSRAWSSTRSSRTWPSQVAPRKVPVPECCSLYLDAFSPLSFVAQTIIWTYCPPSCCSYRLFVPYLSAILAYGQGWNYRLIIDNR